jgi:Protein of unknown function (DUF3485)
VHCAIGPLLVATAAVVVAGGVHGVQTDRWHSSAQLEQAIARLDHVPLACGDWRGEELPYEADDMARAGIKRCVFRRYRNQRTREVVSLLLVCGRGGPISVHTPDICYTGAGYRQISDALTKIVEWDGGQKGTFRVARFGKPAVIPTQLEIYWSWSRDGRSWEAPENPRVPLARLPSLYKLYVVREFVAGSREETFDSCQEFLRRALFELGQALASSDGT